MENPVQPTTFPEPQEPVAQIERGASADCATPLPPDPYTTACTLLAQWIRVQLTFASIAAVGTLQNRTPWGTTTIAWTPESSAAFGLLPVLGIAWLMARKSKGIPFWSIALVGLCGLSLVGRARLLFGDGSNITGFAMIFIALGSVVDVATAAVAVTTLREWLRRRRTRAAQLATPRADLST